MIGEFKRYVALVDEYLSGGNPDTRRSLIAETEELTKRLANYDKPCNIHRCRAEPGPAGEYDVIYACRDCGKEC